MEELKEEMDTEKRMLTEEEIARGDFRPKRQKRNFEYTNPEFKQRVDEQQKESESALGIMGLTKQDAIVITGQLIANFNKFFDREGSKIPKQMEDIIKNVEGIIEEAVIPDAEDPNVYLSLAQNPEIRRLIIELFKLRLKQMGRTDTAIREDITDSEVTDASVAIVLASILLTSEVNLTYQYSADETDLANYLKRIKAVFHKEIAKLGGRYRRKTKYSRKRKSKSKRKHSTRRKHKKRRGSRHR
jgi:hypothetical protein